MPQRLLPWADVLITYGPPSEHNGIVPWGHLFSVAEQIVTWRMAAPTTPRMTAALQILFVPRDGVDTVRRLPAEQEVRLADV